MDDEFPEYTSFQCGHCGTHSHSLVLASEFYDEEPDRGSLIYRYRLVRCTACDEIVLLMAMEIGFDYGRKVYEKDTPVYPAPPRSLSSAVPEPLQRCFHEARNCYQVRAYTACALMCRRTLETLASDRGVEVNNLAKAIEQLKEDGDLDNRLFEWCNELRLAGNGAAHDVGQSVTQADAKDMIELTEAVIDYIYVFQARYQEFKKRRES